MATTATLFPGGHFLDASPPTASRTVYPGGQFESVQINDILKFNGGTLGGTEPGAPIEFTNPVIFDSTATFVQPATFQSNSIFQGTVNITNNDNSSSPTTGALIVAGGLGISGDIFSASTVNGTSFNSTSDARYKKDIKMIENAMCMIKDVDVVEYKLRKFTRNTDSKRLHYGVLAQDLLEKGLGDLVTKNVKDGKLSVNYNGITGLLLKATQELNERLERIEKKMEEI